MERRFKHLHISKRKKPELRCEPCKVSGQGKLCHRISKAWATRGTYTEFPAIVWPGTKLNTEDLEGRSLPAAGLYFISPIKALCCIFSAARRCAAKPTNSSRLHSPASLPPLRPGVLSSTDTTENLEIQLNNFSDAVLLPPAYCKYFLFRGVKKKKQREEKKLSPPFSMRGGNW